ncbi:MAG: hypothetical protein AAF363_21645 [Bacteroidota bacterium]
MTEQDKIDFFHSKRIYAEAMVHLLEAEGTASVHKRLGELFAQETLKFFSANFTRDELYNTIMAMERDDLVYRDESLNNL